MKIILGILLTAFPWKIRRPLLEKLFGYKLSPKSRIGLALAFPKMLILEEHSRIGNMTVCRNLDLVHLKPYASVGKGNWITGFPTGTGSRHFAHETERKAELVLEEHAAVTNRHLIDATNSVKIGRFTTFAGFHSQILTHSIDIETNRQSSKPVSIGEYCFIGTNCVILGGASLPNKSVLGAKSLLNKRFDDPNVLYAGVPAKAIQPIPSGAAYFSRKTGFVE